MANGILNSLDRFEERARRFKTYCTHKINEQNYGIPFPNHPEWDEVENNVWMTESMLDSVNAVVSAHIKEKIKDPLDPDIWEPVYKYTSARSRKDLEFFEEMRNKCGIWLMWSTASRTLVESTLPPPTNNNWSFQMKLFYQTGNGIIIDDSIVIDAIKDIRHKDGVDAESVIAEVGEIVKSSNNVAALGTYRLLANHLGEEKPDKGTTKQYWDMLVGAVPALAKISMEFAKIFLGGPDAPMPPMTV